MFRPQEPVTRIPFSVRKATPLSTPLSGKSVQTYHSDKATVPNDQKVMKKACASNQLDSTYQPAKVGQPSGVNHTVGTRPKLNDMGFKQFVWRITGMDCPSCASKVSQAVEGIEGVSSVTVTFSTQKLVVDYYAKENQDTEATINKVIKKLGFELEASVNAGDSSKSKDHLAFAIISAALFVAVMVNVAFPSFGSYALGLATLIGLFPISKKAYHLLRQGSPFSIELLMTVAAIGALYLGESIEAAMVLWLFLLGEKLEGLSSQKARQGIASLMSLAPDTATKVCNDGTLKRVDLASLAFGDVIEVSAGERLGVDMCMTSEYGEFDKSALTGESVAVTHYQGEVVSAGSLVEGQVVRGTVASKKGDSAIDRIITLIEKAEQNRAPVERFIDNFSRVYTPLVLVVALLTILIPVVFFGLPFEQWLYRALTLLLIACPCALVISTPAAMTSALATAARAGMLVKGGAVLERLAKSTTIAFDKTGTLTVGKPKVTDIVPVNPTTSHSGGSDLSEDDLLHLASALEQGFHHPLAAAVVNKAESVGLYAKPADKRKALPGHGVEGQIDGKQYRLTKVDMTIWQADDVLRLHGKSVAVLSSQGINLGYIAWQDTLRHDAKEAMAKLRAMGLKVIMLTGDSMQSAEVIASELDIETKADLLPEAKVEHIRELAAEGTVVMVGDGINDAPAMRSASIGIAMGSGSDVALEVADGALTQNDLNKMVALVGLSRKTMTIVRQNVAFALGLKGLFLVTSILGITGLWLAVLADSGATALVTLNAMRLLRRVD